MAEADSIISYILFLVGLLITLLFPVPIKEEYRLFAITSIIVSFIIFVLSKYNSRLEKQKEGLGNLDKRFKTLEDLNEIRLDIKELQRRVFK